MKKLIALCIATALIASLTACNGTTTTAESDTSASSQTVATTALQTEAPTEATTEATEYKIHLPYSCFPAGGLPTDSDLILTNEDRECGIISKEKVSTGGMIITVEKDKYDKLLEHQKNKLCELIEREQADMYIDRIEYNDDFSEIVEYQVPEETEPEHSSDDDQNRALLYTLPYTDYSHNQEINYESVYYQALLKKNDDSEIITCTYIVKDSEGEVLDTSVYPST